MTAPDLINCTIRHEQWYTQPDSGDGGTDADVVPLMGAVRFIPQINRAALAPQYAVQMGIITGYIDTDGQLKASKGGPVGVRLPANDPVLGLQSLPYKVEFSLLTTAAGIPVSVAGTTFTVPATDTTVWLSSVLPAPGATSAGITKGDPGDPVDDVQYNSGTGNVEFYVDGDVVGTLALSVILAAVTGGAPAALDTLNELAAALGDDANFAATITTALAGKQPIDADITAIAALASAANKAPYATGSGAWALTDFTAAGRALVDDADADTQRGTLGVALARTGYGVVALGDSITANYGDQNQLREMEGPLSRACAEAGQNPLFRGTFATGGYTLAQILSTHVPTVVALSPKPWAAVILGGTNDAGASSGVGFSVSTAIGTLTSICNALRAANIQPILATLTPRSDTSLVNQNVGNYNRALWRFALNSGYDVVDYNKVVVNPATGGFLTGYAQSDNIHPDFKAVKIMGQELARVFDGMQKPSVAPTRATHSADPTNLLGAQGHFQVDTNADGIADGFTNAVPRGATFSVVSDPDGVTKWQRITQPSTATGNNLLQKSISSVVAVGDIIEAVCRVQTSGFDAALVAPSGLTGGTGPAYAFTVGLTGATHDLEPVYNWHTDVNDVLVYLRGAVPSGATGGITINLQAVGVPVSGSCWVQFTEPCVRNLTALGLV